MIARRIVGILLLGMAGALPTAALLGLATQIVAAQTPTAQTPPAQTSTAQPSRSQALAALDWPTPWLESHNPGQAATNPDEYAWRLFIALNWPANTTTRQADPSAPLGADKPVVWETWQNATDVYLDDGQDPGPWTTGRAGATASA